MNRETRIHRTPLSVLAFFFATVALATAVSPQDRDNEWLVVDIERSEAPIGAIEPTASIQQSTLPDPDGCSLMLPLV